MFILIGELKRKHACLSSWRQKAPGKILREDTQKFPGQWVPCLERKVGTRGAGPQPVSGFEFH